MITDNPTKEEMIENVVQSTENALMALTQLEQNLIKGRFKEGIIPYETMCKTLIGQRLWVRDKENEKIIGNFEKISTTAQNIIGILYPYIENLNQLTMLGGDVELREELVNADSPDDAVEDISLIHDQEKIVALLNKSPRNQMSYSKLRSSLGWERKRLDKVLQSYGENSGFVSVVMIGSRKMVKL